MNVSDKILFEDNPSVLTGFQGFAKIDKLGNRFLNLTFGKGTVGVLAVTVKNLNSSETINHLINVEKNIENNFKIVKIAGHSKVCKKW